MGPAWRQSPWWDTLALSTASLALYLALAQEAFHGLDVHVHIFFLTQGHLEHPLHLLYLKIVGTIWPVLRALGMSPHHALRLLSAVGTVIGVACTHRAALRLCATRALALWVTSLAAVVPAIVFFATVAEIHGVFAAFAGGAWWAWAVFVQRPNARASIVMGVMTGLAASVHATGHLLPIAFALAAIAWWKSAGCKRDTTTAFVPTIGLGAALMTHLVLATALALLLQPDRAPTPFQGQWSYVLLTAAAQRTPWLRVLGRVALEEWLVAFFPVSILWLGVWFRRGKRRLVLAIATVVAAYVGATGVVLVDNHERGAYLLPLAFPLALLTSWALPRPLLVVAAAAGLAVSWAQVWAHDHVSEATWVRGFLALTRDQPVALICRDVDEQEAITRAQPDLPFVRVDSLMASAEREEDYPRFCANFDAMAAQLRKGGRIVMITRPAYEALLASGKPFFLRFLRQHIAQHYQVDEVTRDGFVALRVR